MHNEYIFFSSCINTLRNLLSTNKNLRVVRTRCVVMQKSRRPYPLRCYALYVRMCDT
ncbi:Uncharacterized protein APZ42_017755 [Daphnia magna]|uniref:Uncharacterized protein n=1 Tax=Daphnia magna TaxID=35525 RepID=A0A164ZLX3_9CRUS|nr:Uncharacterized protein APZ42_017755 [Daphnia magna]